MFEKYKQNRIDKLNKELYRVCFFGTKDDDGDKVVISKVKKLLKKGADINYSKGDECGWEISPFLCATRRNRIDLMKFLVENGADVFALSPNKENAITIALNFSFHPTTLEYLIKQGVDINARDIKGETALHKECKSINLMSINLLLKNGADPNLQDRFGNTPLNTLINSKNKCVQLLPPERRDLYDRGVIPCIESLVKAGANLNIRNDNGKNPLENELSGEYSREIAYAMIKAGATIATTEYGNSTMEHKLEDVKSYIEYTHKDNDAEII